MELLELHIMREDKRREEIGNDYNKVKAISLKHGNIHII